MAEMKCTYFDAEGLPRSGRLTTEYAGRGNVVLFPDDGLPQRPLSPGTHVKCIVVPSNPTADDLRILQGAQRSGYKTCDKDGKEVSVGGPHSDYDPSRE